MAVFSYRWNDRKRTGKHIKCKSSAREGQPSVKIPKRDLPGGPVVKNPPANAGDMGSIFGLGGSHML